MTTLEGNELRRAVAEEQGYRLELRKGKDLITGEWFFNNRWVSSAAVGEDEVWRFLALEKRIPDYPNDLNTIKDAPLPDNMVIDVRFQMPTATFPKWGVFIYLYGNTAADYREYLSSHPEPATAFWNAWLMMRKAARDV